MEEQGILDTTPQDNTPSGMVHFVLSHSYFMFLGAVIFGIVFDMISGFRIFQSEIYSYGGIAMIILGSVLVYWAQSSSRHTHIEMKKKNTERNFEHGPYKYSRNPTHIGLTVMTLGLGFVLNSFFSIIFVITASVITKFIFLREEEALLEKRYGKPYLEYKKKVGTWV